MIFLCAIKIFHAIDDSQTAILYFSTLIVLPSVIAIALMLGMNELLIIAVVLIIICLIFISIAEKTELNIHIL